LIGKFQNLLLLLLSMVLKFASVNTSMISIGHFQSM
jgi:hypothetical protein